MNKKAVGCIAFVLLFIVFGIFSIYNIGTKDMEKKEEENSQLESLVVTVLAMNEEEVTVQDENHIIYTFSHDHMHANVGDKILLEYTGILDKNKSYQTTTIQKYSSVLKEESDIPKDNGIFKDYYNQAFKKLQNMSLDDKIGQLFLVRYPDSKAIEDLKKYQFGGFVFFEKDFKNKTEQEVMKMIQELQKNASISLFTAVDEEGGKIVRISSNSNLVKEKFKSSKELYEIGGFAKIKEDTVEKSRVLYHLGLNLNLAPVVDVSTDESDYMYERSFGKGTSLTSTYAKTVIEASKGTGVSYTLKHFPGYGNNSDTHTGSVKDERTLDDILANDIPPFESGIEAGAEAVLVSHNIVTSVDENNPASLSPSVHNMLRNRLNFTGIVITDDLAMSATSSIADNAVKALLAGNDLLIVTDYDSSIREVKQALASGTISEDLIDNLAFRILAWKYYKGILHDNEK